MKFNTWPAAGAQLLFTLLFGIVLVLGPAAESYAALAEGADPDALEAFHDAQLAGAGGGPAPFQIANRWTSTATDGFNSGQGNPTNLTYSFVPDGTPISSAFAGDSSTASSLFAFMNSLHGSPAVWQPYFTSAFNRIADLSGLHFTQDIDDGAGGIGSGAVAGVLGVRGDIRIGAHPIIGVNGGVLAYNYFPSNGDMVLDSQDANFYDADDTTFRNIIQHEVGHGLGFNHVEPENQTKLMEPFISTAYTGPQIDDIQALHRNYGDVHEKSNSGAGNETSTNATFLGTLFGTGDTVSIGEDANEPFGTGLNDIEVFLSEDDFISVDDNSDIDFLSFTLNTISSVDLTLTPAGGPAYNQGPDDDVANNEASFDPTSRSNLALTLFQTNGITPISTAADNGLGNVDTILNQVLTAGTYFARITGDANFTQLYQFDVSAVAVPEPTTLAIALLGLLSVVGITGRRR